MGQALLHAAGDCRHAGALAIFLQEAAVAGGVQQRPLGDTLQEQVGADELAEARRRNE
jgi:hypothetical protein